MNINNLFTNPNEIKYSINNVDAGYFYVDFGFGKFFTSQISDNGQYLAYGGDRNILKIYEIKLDKIIKIIKLDYKVLVCQFTFDSSLLYVGCEEGYVFGYDVLDDFKQIFQSKLKRHVYNIITIKNQFIITFSCGTAITKIDLKRNKQVFKYIRDPLNVRRYPGRTVNYSLDAVDYNQVDDLIIIGTNRSIQLWDGKNRRSYLENKDSHECDVQQIQLINNNQNVLSLDVGSNLYKWRIDYIEKDLTKLQEFRVPCEIQSFYSFNQDQNLLMICEGYLKVINSKGETIYTLYHETTECILYHLQKQKSMFFLIIDSWIIQDILISEIEVTYFNIQGNIYLAILQH